jgi:hypothetical protein
MYDRIQNHHTGGTAEYTGLFFHKVAYSGCDILKDFRQRTMEYILKKKMKLLRLEPNLW